MAKSNHQSASDFMDFVYQRIAHGDAEHMRWLKEECEKLVPHLVNAYGPVQDKYEDLLVHSQTLMDELNRLQNRLAKNGLLERFKEPSK